MSHSISTVIDPDMIKSLPLHVTVVEKASEYKRVGAILVLEVCIVINTHINWMGRERKLWRF